jgi:hypothetical protein
MLSAIRIPQVSGIQLATKVKAVNLNVKSSSAVMAQMIICRSCTPFHNDTLSTAPQRSQTRHKSMNFRDCELAIFTKIIIT